MRNVMTVLLLVLLLTAATTPESTRAGAPCALAGHLVQETRGPVYNQPVLPPPPALDGEAPGYHTTEKQGCRLPF